jgi:hypothetical protein
MDVRYSPPIETVESSDAKAKLDILLAETCGTGEPITSFGQLPDLAVPETFDDSLPGPESPVQEGNSPT